MRMTLSHNRPKGRSKPTNVTLNETLLAEAKALGINVSKACEAGLAAEVGEGKARRWQEENKEAIEASNAYVELHGLPLARYRLF